MSIDHHSQRHDFGMQLSGGYWEEPFIAFHPAFKQPLPEGHRFPMIKYELLPEQLLYEGIVEESAFFQPDLLEKKYLSPVHQPAYWRRLLDLELSPREIRRIGFPLNARLIERELRIAQGTVTGAEIALKSGIGFNIAGGTHHAGSNWGEGFCLLNDQAIAASYLLKYHHLKKILIVDLDVHQGNGTAEIFQQEQKVFTFSVHGHNNFPFQKEKSDLDIGLPDDIEGHEYLATLDQNLNKLFNSVQPEFIFYQAGTDVLGSDKMGKFKLTKEDCRQRDKLVFSYCKKFRAPVQISMGGGYSERIGDIVDAHCNTFKEGISTILY